MTYNSRFEDDDSDSALGRAIDHLLDRPAATLLTFLSLASFIAIGVNAAFLQPGIHPAPLFATRAAPAMPIDAQELASGEPGVRTIPAPAARSVALAADPALIRDIQRLLSERGLYGGAIDGVYGPGTREAIERFQLNQNQPVDGEATPRLLALLALAPTPAPVTRDAGVTNSLPVTFSQQEIAAIQRALDTLGFEPGAIDGIMGNATRLAIRRFELSRGMAPFGEPSAQIVAQLERVLGHALER